MTERDDQRRAELFQQLRSTGSSEARDELVESYLPLAQFFARRYHDRGVEHDDLHQVARLALVKAVDRFDPDCGVKFSTYGGRTIDGELKRHFRDKAWSVRVPRSLKEQALEVRQTVETLSNELGRPPTVDEIAERTDLSVETVLEALDVNSAYRAVSIDKPSRDDDDGDNVLVDRLRTTESGYERAESAAVLAELLESVPDREKAILEMRFYRHMSQTQIAAELGISQMHVSRLLRRTLDQLRASVR